MQKNQNYLRRFLAGFLVITVLLMALLIYLGSKIWKYYETTLMNNQKNQIQLISLALANTTETSITEFSDTLEFLCQMEESDFGKESFYRRYISTKNAFVRDLCYGGKGSVTLTGISGKTYVTPVFLTEMVPGKTIWQYRDEMGNFYLVLKKEYLPSKTLCLVIDEEAYYNSLISDIHVGSNGYVVLKTSANRIIMHPSKLQWGIDLISGRRELYPNGDYKSLEAMIDRQQKTPKGVNEYYSYWWTAKNVPRVKKVAAHAHAKIGNSYWVISSVVDYSDLSSPIQSSFRRLTIAYMAILLIFLSACGYIIKLLMDRLRDMKQIDYLKELNATLNEIHRSEETLAHRQRLQVMGAMAGGIAHEFNNFLTPIMGYADLLMTELPPDSDAMESAQEIYKASEKASDVIRNISAMSRKNVETVYRSFLARKFLDSCTKILRTMCPSNVHLSYESALGDGYILGNGTQLQQVLLNLCMNSVHAIGHKEGHIKIFAFRVQRNEILHLFPLEEIPASIEAYLQIDVRDDGCGMDPTTLRHIFEPFFTTKKSGQGTGLGLALADQIIRSHRGYLYAESEVGKGSVFHIFLPITDEEVLPVHQGEEKGQRLRLIVADDNQKILELLHRNFERLGLEIACCTKPEEITALLEEGADVLAVDDTIQGEDGIDFCLSIRGKYPSLLKIVMATQVTRELVEAKQHHIIDDYVEKPVSDAILLEKIRELQRDRAEE